MEVLKRRENYFKGLQTTGSNHDHKVAMRGLLIIRALKKEFEQKLKEVK